MASFDDYIKMYERINQQFISIISPCIDSLSSETMGALNTLNRMAYSPIQEWGESCAHTFTPFQEIFDNLINSSAVSIAAAFQDPSVLAASFQEITPPDILQGFECLNTFFTEQFSAAFASLTSNADVIESDYVIVDEKPIKEMRVPDSLTIPIGNYRIKIRTDHFIAIMFGILTLAATFITSISSSNVELIRKEQLCVQTQQWKNQILERLFDTIDMTFSTGAEFINVLKEAAEAQIKAAHKQEEAAEAQERAAQAQEKAAQALEEAADSFREASDSVKEPEYIEPHK